LTGARTRAARGWSAVHRRTLRRNPTLIKLVPTIESVPPRGELVARADEKGQCGNVMTERTMDATRTADTTRRDGLVNAL
jgi:hypothetical protein